MLQLRLEQNLQAVILPLLLLLLHAIGQSNLQYICANTRPRMGTHTHTHTATKPHGVCILPTPQHPKQQQMSW